MSPVIGHCSVPELHPAFPIPLKLCGVTQRRTQIPHAEKQVGNSESPQIRSGQPGPSSPLTLHLVSTLSIPLSSTRSSLLMPLVEGTLHGAREAKTTPLPRSQPYDNLWALPLLGLQAVLQATVCLHPRKTNYSADATFGKDHSR